MKYPVIVPVKITFFVDENATENDFYDGILKWLETETERLRNATGPERWPSCATETYGLGAAVIYENTKNNKSTRSSAIELDFNGKLNEKH